ncbi:MAG: hypothetical protein QOI77_3301 [Blastocatellia bacterium]|nr:hypothetical protein [Blastocatellia bacterium]
MGSGEGGVVGEGELRASASLPIRALIPIAATVSDVVTSVPGAVATGSHTPHQLDGEGDPVAIAPGTDLLPSHPPSSDFLFAAAASCVSRSIFCA